MGKYRAAIRGARRSACPVNGDNRRSQTLLMRESGAAERKVGLRIEVTKEPPGVRPGGLLRDDAP
jgi:hypothetical protein